GEQTCISMKKINIHFGPQMKRGILAIVSILFLALTGRAQTGTISGNIQHAPIWGVTVNVVMHDSLLLTPGSILLADTTVTDSSGNYIYNYSISASSTAGYVVVYLIDCMANIVGDTVIWDIGLNKNPVVNLDY